MNYRQTCSKDGFFTDNSVQVLKGTSLRCAPYVDGSDPAFSKPGFHAPDADGKCAAGLYQPTTENGLQSRAEAYGDKSKAVQIITESMNKGVDQLPHVSPQWGTLTGPGTVPGATTTTTTTPEGGGSPVTTTQTTTYNVTYTNNTWNYTTTVTTTAPGGGTTTETGDAPEVETCGLPGKPPCRIDEGGTPTTGNFAGAEAELEARKVDITGAISGAGDRTSLPWTWSFSVPTGTCTPFAVGTATVSIGIDPCSSSGVDLFRSLIAWFLASLTGLHLWRTAVDVQGGV